MRIGDQIGVDYYAASKALDLGPIEIFDDGQNPCREVLLDFRINELFLLPDKVLKTYNFGLKIGPLWICAPEVQEFIRFRKELVWILKPIVSHTSQEFDAQMCGLFNPEGSFVLAKRMHPVVLNAKDVLNITFPLKSREHDRDQQAKSVSDDQYGRSGDLRSDCRGDDSPPEPDYISSGGKIFSFGKDS